MAFDLSTPKKIISRLFHNFAVSSIKSTRLQKLCTQRKETKTVQRGPNRCKDVCRDGKPPTNTAVFPRKAQRIFRKYHSRNPHEITPTEERQPKSRLRKTVSTFYPQSGIQSALRMLVVVIYRPRRGTRHFCIRVSAAMAAIDRRLLDGLPTIVATALRHRLPNNALRRIGVVSQSGIAGLCICRTRKRITAILAKLASFRTFRLAGRTNFRRRRRKGNFPAIFRRRPRNRHFFAKRIAAIFANAVFIQAVAATNTFHNLPPIRTRLPFRTLS